MINLVGIHGLYGVGKDTVAQIIHEVYGHEIKHFAEPVYKSLWNLNPWILLDSGEFTRLQDIVRDHGWDYAKSLPEVRRGLQVTGTENGRDIHGADCWVEYAAEQYNSFGFNNVVNSISAGHWSNGSFVPAYGERASKPSWAYSDLRFENEHAWLFDMGGSSIKVTGPQRRGGGDATKKHSSEAGLPDHLFDAIINNDGTLDDLRVKVINAMEYLDSPNSYELRTF